MFISVSINMAINGVIELLQNSYTINDLLIKLFFISNQGLSIRLIKMNLTVFFFNVDQFNYRHYLFIYISSTTSQPIFLHTFYSTTIVEWISLFSFFA